MDNALRDLKELSDEHQRRTQAQRDSLTELRTRSLALLRRGTPAEAIATAVGLSTAAVISWTMTH